MLAITLDIGMNGGENDTGRDDLITNKTVLSFEGTGEVDDVVWVEGRQDAMAPWTKITVDAVVTGDGKWEIDGSNSLDEGAWYVRAAAAPPDDPSEADEYSDSDARFEIDLTPPEPASVALDTASDSDGDRLTNSATPTFTGTTEPGDKVTLTLKSGEGDSFDLPAAEADDEGVWSVTVPGLAALSEGDWDVSAVVEDVAGNPQEDPATPLVITIDTTPPTVDISADKRVLGIAPDGNLEEAVLTITLSEPPLTDPVSGQGFTKEDIVIVPIGAGPDTTTNSLGVLAKKDGRTFEITFRPAPGVPRTRQVEIYVNGSAFTDRAGNQSLISQLITIEIFGEPPTVVISRLPGAGDAPVGVGQTVDVLFTLSAEMAESPEDFTRDDIQVIGKDPDGNEVPAPGSLGDLRDAKRGAFTFVATFTPDPSFQGTAEFSVAARAFRDRGGNDNLDSNRLEVDIDTVGPARPPAPELDSDTGVPNDNITNTRTPTLSGTAPGADFVDVEALLAPEEDSPEPTPIPLGTAEVNGAGGWELTVDAVDQLQTDGVYAITVQARDEAGNRSQASESLEITLDTAPPEVSPATLAPTDDSGDPTDLVTNVTTPTFTGTAEPAAKVTLTLTRTDGDRVVLEPVVTEANRTWSVIVPAGKALPDGVWKVDVTAEDVAGNVAVATEPLEITIKTDKPEITAAPDLAPQSDSGIADDDDVTNLILPVLQGTAPLGTTVEVFVLRPGSTTPELLAAGLEVEEVTGAWSLTVANSHAFADDGDYVVRFTATDAVDNVSNPSQPLTVTIDRTRPRAIELSPPPMSPRGTPVETIDAIFSEEVFGVTLNDFDLRFRTTLGGSPRPISVSPPAAVAAVAPANPSVWQLTGLESLTGASGFYELRLTPQPAVTDLAGNPIDPSNPAAPPTVTWQTDTTTPRVDLLGPVEPDYRNVPVAGVDLKFSKVVNGVDPADFRLERDGQPIPLDAASVRGTGSIYRIEGLGNLQNADGTYTLTLVAEGSDIEDARGNPLGSGASVSWTIDTAPRTGAFEPVATPVGTGIRSVMLAFDDLVSGLSRDSFTLTRDGAAVSLADATLSPGINPPPVAARYLLSSLGSANDVDGVYELSVDVTGLQNAIGNPVTPVAPLTWTVDTAAPVATLSGIAPFVRSAATAADLTFSLPVAGVDPSDFLLTVRRPDGTSESLTGFTVTGTGDSYTVGNLAALTAGDGDYRLELIAVGSEIVRENPPANPLLANAAIEWRVDATAPTVELSQLSWDGLATFRVRAVFSEPVTGLTTSAGVAIGGVGGTVGAIEEIGTSRREYRFDVTVAGAPTDPATVTLSADSAFDYARSGNRVSDVLQLITDYTAPRVTLTGPAVTNLAPFDVTAVFDEPVTGLTAADVQVVNGSVAGLTPVSGAGTTFTITVTPAADGLVTVLLPTAAAADASGNPSTASNVLQTRYDATSPTVTLANLSGAATRAALLRVAVTFSEPVTGLAAGDFTIVNGSVAGLSGTGGDYVLLVEPAAQTAPDGTLVEISLPAAAAQDAPGNPSGPATPQPLQILSDRIAPGVTLTGPASGVITIVFTEDVVGFDLSDFTLSVNGRSVTLRDARLTQVNANDVWQLDLNTVIAAAGPGQYELRLAATGSAIADPVGNPLGDAATLGFVVDETSPVANWIGIPSLAANPLSSASIQFSEPVIGLTAADIILLRDGVLVVPPGGITVSPAAGPAANYLIDGLAASTAVEGQYEIRLVASPAITDLSGNAIAGDAVASWRLDATAPVASFGPVTPSPRLPAVFSADVFFSEPVVGIDIGDFRLLRDGVALRMAGARLAPIGTSGTQFRISNLSRLTRLAGDYTLSLDPAGSRITDIAGNPLAAAAAVTWTNAGAPTQGPLTAAFESVIPSPRSAPVDSVAITFSAVVTGVDAGDFVLQRTVAGTTTQLTGFTVAGSGRRRTVEGLLPLTNDPGQYTLQLRSAGSGIASVSGQPLEADSLATWTRLTGPVVAPEVRMVAGAVLTPGGAVDTVALFFNAQVTGVRLADLRLTRDGIPLSLSGTVLTELSGNLYQLRGLAAIAAAAGTYELRLVAAGSGITSATGLPLAADGVETWNVTVEAVRAAFLAVDPVRAAPLAGVRLRFSVPVLGADVDDFELTRDGVPVPLYGVTVLGRATSWVIGNLAAAQAAPGTYVLRLRATDSQIRSELGDPLAEDAVVSWRIG